MTRKNKAFLASCVLCLTAVGYNFYCQQQEESASVVQTGNLQETLFGASDERTDGSYFTLCDQDTQEAVEYMSRQVYEGDELLTGDNRHYRVTKIDGDRAYCQLMAQRELRFATTDFAAAQVKMVAAQPAKYQAVAIYATHTDESYVPTSGTESKKGGGDILQIASVIADELEKQGIEVLHSENIHDPHDVNAYQRSRKTAAQLLQGAPAAIIDVHRDGVPDPNYYATEIDGKQATQIRLVVGKQNQNSQANIAFAENMKAYYDQEKPGLIKSIYMAKGNYNQDMAPNSILLEVGTHTNTLEAAAEGAKEFADVLPAFLGIASTQAPSGQAPAPEAPVEQGKTGTNQAIFWLIGLAVLGGLAFVFISKGTSMGKK